MSSSIIEQIDWKVSQQNFLFFHETVLGYDVSWFHKEWLELIAKNDRVLITASRGVGKSTFLRSYAIWFALVHPRVQIIYFSHSKPLAQKHLQQLKLEFDKGVLKKFRPEDTDAWTKDSVNLPNGSVISTGSVGSPMRGVRANIVIADDILSEHGNISIRGQTEWFFNIALNIPTPELPPSSVWLIGTPITFFDLYRELTDNRAFLCKRYPLMANDEETRERYPPNNNGYLWPERRGKEYAERKKLEEGELAFSREYLLSPISPDNAVYPYKLIRRACDMGKDKGLWVSGTPPEGRYYGGVDLAISDKEGADFTVITMLRRNEDSSLELVYIKRGHFSRQRIEEEIRSAYHRFKPNVFMVEANAFQKAFTEELIHRGLPIKEFLTTPSSKHSATMGLRLLLENERLTIPFNPYMDEENLENVRTLVEELSNIAFKETRAGNLQIQGLLKHDDCFMSLILSCEAAKYGGGAFTQIGEYRDSVSGNKEAMMVGSPQWWGGPGLFGRRWRSFKF